MFRERLLRLAVWVTLPRDDRGSSLVEYALLVALIAAVTVVALRYFQTSTAQKLSSASSSITNAG